MQYIEVTLNITPLSPFSEILMAEMCEIGFESFVENDSGFQAYIPQMSFNEAEMSQLPSFLNSDCEINYQILLIEDQNWNAVWESSYEPVKIEDFCFIHAPFHLPDSNVQYNVLIEPKMSFGTAHHATTYNMLLYLRDEELQNKRVLDMGCGTAVLAIVAAMRGAAYVEAIDNDEWAYNNSIENVERNVVGDVVKVLHGDASLLKGKVFDIIIANINRNILLEDIEHYAAVLAKKGILLLSGFYEKDIPCISEECKKHHLRFESFKEKDEWVAVKFWRED